MAMSSVTDKADNNLFRQCLIVNLAKNIVQLLKYQILRTLDSAINNRSTRFLLIHLPFLKTLK